VLVTAAAEVQVALACLIVEVNVSVDNGIVGIKDGTVVEILERTCGRIAHSYANLKVLSLVGGVLLIVGAEEHIVFTIALIYLRCPKAVYVPLILATSLINLTARFPVTEAVTNVSLEAILQRCSVHIILTIAGM
jgi:hypothetical protein